MSKVQNIVLPLVSVSVAVIAIILSAGLILNSRTDNGFLERQCHTSTGHPSPYMMEPIHWRAPDYPVPVYVEPQWLPHFVEQTKWWNDKLGEEAFGHPRALEFYELPADPYIVVTGANVGSHAKARLRWIDHCVLRRVEIAMPALADVKNDIIARHELGHALGLDHDETEGWVMHPHYAFAGAHISERDLELLRSTFR